MTNLYVAGLPFGSTEDDLLKLFSYHGNVERVSIILDHETQRSRGFAFVEMSEDKAAQEAIADLDQTRYGGRTIAVRVARPRTSAPRQDRDYSDNHGRHENPRW